MLLSAEAISKTYGHREVIQSASLVIENGESIGLVGDNGAGKTTLLRILMGDLKPDSGDLRIRTERIGYLPQIPEFTQESRVRDVIDAPYAKVARITRKIAELESLMEDPNADLASVGEEYGRLQEELVQAKNANHTDVTSFSLAQLGLNPSILDRRMRELSGGEVTKVMLGRILVQSRDVDLLFLDEPTSHLDIGTIEWLEDYLIDFPGAIMTVSHDRYFLDRVVSRIIDLKDGMTRSYLGSFTEYTMVREIEDSTRTKEAEKNLAERRRQERVIAEQQRRWRYMTTFKTRMRLLEKTKVIEGPARGKEIEFRINTTPRGGVNVIMARDMVVKRGDRTILKVGEIDLDTGEKLGIFGPNGSGKSSFIKSLMGELPHEGKLWLAPGATIGYFAQSHDGLDPDLTAEQQLMLVTGPDGRAMARKTLSSFLVHGKDAERRISTLSGGERARVALANMVVSGKNLLILDEPTNYLDIRSKDAVERALMNYAGTIVVVSHDRYLLDSICNRIGVVSNGEMKVFPGSYSEVRRKIDMETLNDRILTFTVTSKFVDWSTNTRYKAGDEVRIPITNLDRYKQWIERGFLKSI
jgi:ATP-binding cassette subfamily F protein 3